MKYNEIRIERIHIMHCSAYDPFASKATDRLINKGYIRKGKFGFERTVAYVGEKFAANYRLPVNEHLHRPAAFLIAAGKHSGRPHQVCSKKGFIERRCRWVHHRRRRCFSTFIFL